MVNIMKPKSKWPLASRIAFLLALVIAIGLVAFGCVSGLAAVGWSGGTVADGTLYVGSQQGRLVAVSLTDDNRAFSEVLTPVSQSGLFGCSASSGGLGGCAGGAAAVPIYGTPVVSGNLTYIAGYNGKVYAYSYSNNNLATRWVYPREGNLSSIVGGIAVAQGKVFFGCTDGKVYALDAEVGDYLWESVATGDKIWGTPAVDGDTLYIGSFDKNLYAIDINTGEAIWEQPFKTQGSIFATPLIRDGVVYIGSFDRKLYAVDAATGKEIWHFPQDDSVKKSSNWFWAQPVIINDVLYVGCLDHFVYVINPTTGVKITELDLKNPLASAPVVVADSIVFANTKGVVYSVSTINNELKELVDLKKTVNGPLAAYGEIVYIHTQENVIQRINAVTGALLNPISLNSSQ
jgi:outer membrane protein assembly factor BamB